jgi:hypothetical protein
VASARLCPTTFLRSAKPTGRGLPAILLGAGRCARWRLGDDSRCRGRRGGGMGTGALRPTGQRHARGSQTSGRAGKGAVPLVGRTRHAACLESLHARGWPSRTPTRTQGQAASILDTEQARKRSWTQPVSKGDPRASSALASQNRCGSLALEKRQFPAFLQSPTG